MSARVGLFVPCFVDIFHPDVGMAALRLLERLGVAVEYPLAQTCCGQPMANAGSADEARRLRDRFDRVFADYEHVVAPSASCVAFIRGSGEAAAGDAVAGRTFELCEYIHDVLGVTALKGAFPHRVGLHPACHGLRELRLAAASERMEARHDKVRTLLQSLDGIELVEPRRPDECCGFGGTFSVDEPAVSEAMGLDRVHDHAAAGAEVITATDVSCLMHLEGLIQRHGIALRVMHVAEILVASAEGR